MAEIADRAADSPAADGRRSQSHGACDKRRPSEQREQGYSKPSAPARLAAPLLAIAIGYLVLQIRVRPTAHELLKRVLLSLAFIFWSASQIDPNSGWAPVADDLAIALFVLDLGLIIWDELHTEPALGADRDESNRHERFRRELQPCPCCGRVADARAD